MPMRMMFRIKDVDRARGFVRYFWKATPVPALIDDSDAEDGTAMATGIKDKVVHPRHGLLEVRRALGLRTPRT